MTDHPVLQLRGLLRAEFTTDLPQNVHPITEWVADPQFFPGATGLLTEDSWDDVVPGQSRHFDELPPPPKDGVLVVGHYFASVATYERVLKGELGGLHRTWGALRRLLAATTPREVFLTNAYMGVVDADKDTARFPTTPEYDRRCANFLAAEIELLQPRAVICLGGPAVRMLARVATNDLASWQKSTLQALRDVDQALVRACHASGETFDAAAVSHPSAVQSTVERVREAARVASTIAG